MNDKHKLLVNGALFGVTASALFLYGYAYFRHMSSGLVPSIWDKLILLCTLISTIFYGMSLHTSYIHYTRNQLSIVLNSPSPALPTTATTTTSSSSPSSSSSSSYTTSPSGVSSVTSTPSSLGAASPLISQLINPSGSPSPMRKQRSSVDITPSSSSSVTGGVKEMVGLGVGAVSFGFVSGSGNREKRVAGSEDMV